MDFLLLIKLAVVVFNELRNSSVVNCLKYQMIIFQPCQRPR